MRIALFLCKLSLSYLSNTGSLPIRNRFLTRAVNYLSLSDIRDLYKYSSDIHDKDAMRVIADFAVERFPQSDFGYAKLIELNVGEKNYTAAANLINSVSKKLTRQKLSNYLTDHLESAMKRAGGNRSSVSHDIEEEVAAIRALISNESADFSMRHYAFRLLYQKLMADGDQNSAVRYLEHPPSSFLKYPDHYIYAASCYMERSIFEKARSYVMLGQSIFPGNAKVVEKMAELYQRSGGQDIACILEKAAAVFSREGQKVCVVDFIGKV